MKMKKNRLDYLPPIKPMKFYFPSQLKEREDKARQDIRRAMERSHERAE